MKTTDLFTINRTSKKLNETLEKTFGRKLKLETFNLAQLEDARNKLRTQIHDVRNSSGFNENLENEAFTEAQWMLDAINAEIMQRESISESPLNDSDDVSESAPKGWEGTVKAMKKHKEIDNPYALAHYMKNKGYKSHKKESIGESMANLREGEIQQASAIVTAKTMVDRVGRWIEELSGMENDTLLTLGDSIRDEMGAEQAKTFISACAPAIQQALQNLKDTREALSSSVRALTGEEQATDMLGGDDSGSDMSGPDSLDMGSDDEMDMGAPADDFAASEPGVGGMETAGREQRESIERGNSLLRVLAG